MGRGPRVLTPQERLASLLADVDALPKAKARSAAEGAIVSAEFPIPAFSIIKAAAKARRLSISSYMRRAAYALACYDLGIPVLEAISRDPRVARAHGATIEDADGSRFGSWQIERMEGDDAA